MCACVSLLLLFPLLRFLELLRVRVCRRVIVLFALRLMGLVFFFVDTMTLGDYGFIVQYGAFLYNFYSNAKYFYLNGIRNRNMCLHFLLFIFLLLFFLLILSFAVAIFVFNTKNLNESIENKWCLRPFLECIYVS